MSPSSTPSVARLAAAVRPYAERIDALSLRERVLVFGAGVVLLYVAWQSLLMDPLAARASAAERRLQELQQRTVQAASVGAALEGSPALALAARERALRERLAVLDAQLQDASSGYVAPERMVELVREVLERQQGLRLVVLRNLPVESLAASADAAPAADATGPFVHPVELVVEGDYLAIVAYLDALEQLPWRMQWRRLELESRDYPVNRVRLELATVGLSRAWLGV